MWGLTLVPALDRPDLLAEPVAAALRRWADAQPIHVAEIDPALADTAAFCDHYGVPLEASANCVIVATKRAGEVRYAACVVRATTRADVNGVVRRHLGARKASFAPRDTAVAMTGMEYGGITPFGLPDDWPVLVDPPVTELPHAVLGSGVRRSKLVVPGALLGRHPGVTALPGLGRPA